MSYQQAMATVKPNPRSRLETARRIEVAGLIVLSVLALMQAEPAVNVTAVAFMAMAVLLVPRPGAAEKGLRGGQRLLLVNHLQAEALQLRMVYTTAGTRPAGEERSMALWQAQREILTWQVSVAKRMRQFPEIAGILDMRLKPGSVLEEIDSCISGLSEIRRLAALSERLGLPI